jgi:hypothetical protein
MYSYATFVETGLSFGINATELESFGIESLAASTANIHNVDGWFIYNRNSFFATF